MSDLNSIEEKLIGVSNDLLEFRKCQTSYDANQEVFIAEAKALDALSEVRRLRHMLKAIDIDILKRNAK